MSKIAEVSLGINRLVVYEKDIIFKNIRLLAQGYAEVKEKHSLLTRYPMLEDETNEEWTNRILPLLADENARLPGEDAKQYAARLYSQKLEKQELTFEILEVIAKIVNQSEKVTREAFEEASYTACKSFIYAVYSAADLNVEDFK